MKHILNFYVHETDEGNELRWVGYAKKGSQYEIRRSVNELDFDVVKMMDSKGQEALAYETLDTSNALDTYYQVAYLQGGEEVEVSPVVRIRKKDTFSLRNLIIRMVVAILLIALAVMMGRNFAKRPPRPMSAPPSASLQAAKVVDVAYQNFNTTIDALGQVISTQPIDIVSEVSGRILKGDVVLRKARNFKKGDLLFKIDSEEAILNLKSQRSNFLNALVLMLPDLKLDFPKSFDKWNNYFQNIDIHQPLAALPTISDEREKTFIATKNILGQYYAIKSAEERLSRYEIKAPYSGIITDVYTDAGSVANPGTRVVRVMRTDQLELELPVRKEDIEWVRIGTQVQLFSEDKQQRTSGSVTRISNTIDPTTQSVNVYVNINPSGMKLYEGMYMSVELAGRAINSAMELDRRAVVGENQVFVMNADSTLEQKTVRIHKVNTETILFSGLKEGEQVVNDNLLGLTDGIKIIPLKE